MGGMRRDDHMIQNVANFMCMCSMQSVLAKAAIAANW